MEIRELKNMEVARLAKMATFCYLIGDRASGTCALIDPAFETDRILKKVAEESGEVLLAMKNENRDEIVYEVSDLFFHTIVALGNAGVPMADIHEELGRRFGQSGLKKKAGKDSHE